MKIHFVCRGNYYRSRLAEAYLKSKQISGIDVSSSGIQAEESYVLDGPIAWYAMRLIKNNNLIPFMKAFPTQTTEELLLYADLTIFMTQHHYEYARDLFNFSGDYEVWSIPDLDQFHDEDVSLDDDIARMHATEKTFEEIKQ